LACHAGSETLQQVRRKQSISKPLFLLPPLPWAIQPKGIELLLPSLLSTVHARIELLLLAQRSIAHERTHAAPRLADPGPRQPPNHRRVEVELGGHRSSDGPEAAHHFDAPSSWTPGYTPPPSYGRAAATSSSSQRPSSMRRVPACAQFAAGSNQNMMLK
jgi:hypothetical protein